MAKRAKPYSELESLQAVYKDFARRADARLRSLEKLSNVPHFQTATMWAYNLAQRYISEWSVRAGKTPGTRFGQSVKGMSALELRSKIQDIKAFLDKPTSTKRGIVSVYKKRADTFNDKYGTNMTWEDVAAYFEAGNAEKNDTEYGSKTALYAIGEIQTMDDDLIDKIKESSARTQHITGDAKIDQAIVDMLKNQGLTKETLFRS